VVCPACHQPTYRRVVDLPSTDLKEFHTPIEMYSIAVDSIQEVRELQRRCPDVAIEDDPTSEMFGIPLAANRQQKRALLRASGYIETN